MITSYTRRPIDLQLVFEYVEVFNGDMAILLLHPSTGTS